MLNYFFLGLIICFPLMVFIIFVLYSVSRKYKNKMVSFAKDNINIVIYFVLFLVMIFFIYFFNIVNDYLHRELNIKFMFSDFYVFVEYFLVLTLLILGYFCYFGFGREFIEKPIEEYDNAWMKEREDAYEKRVKIKRYNYTQFKNSLYLEKIDNVGVGYDADLVLTIKNDSIDAKIRFNDNDYSVKIESEKMNAHIDLDKYNTFGQFLANTAKV